MWQSLLLVLDILQSIPTVTQAYHIFFVVVFCDSLITKNKRRQKKSGGWWRFSATPATRTLKISAFYTKFSKNHEIYLSLLLVADILQTTVQPSHKPLYLICSADCSFVD